MRSLRALVILVLCGVASPVARSVRPLETIDLKPCAGERAGARAECGQLLVPENRTTGLGRRIPINIIVLRAEQRGARTALFLLAGGPGQGSTSMTLTANSWMAPLRASMDMVLMDQRGTGGSNALPCETDIATNPAAAFGHVRDPDMIKRCLAALQPRADLTQYTTDAAVADMEDLRVALGYDSIAMYGGSYGTRIAQAYLRRHPDRTRAVVIDGVLPFDVGGPLSYARSLDGSIDRMLANCRETPACQQANPSLAGDLDRILKRLDQAPAKATVRPSSSDAVTVTMTRGDFLYAMRGMLYNPGAQDQLPPLITQAAATGDLSVFAQRYWSRAVSMTHEISYGMHLSVLCPEDVNVLTDARIKAETGATRIGDYIVNEYRVACALWPKATVAPDFRTPVTARVPVLLVSGKYDPVTPPEFGERIAKSLPLARTIVVSTSGHGSAAGCPRAAALYVLAKGTLEGMPEVCR